jgi:hypothetical protein
METINLDEDPQNANWLRRFNRPDIKTPDQYLKEFNLRTPEDAKAWLAESKGSSKWESTPQKFKLAVQRLAAMGGRASG